MAQSPLLHIPTKRTDEVELSGAFKTYIANVYQDDPEKYASEIATLYRLRQDTRGAGKDITGRDILYRYYGQLELLDLRFPVDEKHVKILFTWFDAFTQKPISQYSIAYEKACTIFNIAATCSSIGALQNRFEASGLKMAFNYFQAAAGLFLYINDNFLHAPSVDLSRDSIKTLVDLMLGQAQECFMEKVLLEKKKGALVAKLAAQASHVYQSVADGIMSESIRGQFDRAWVELVKVKVKYFQSLALYHKSIQAESDTKYGDSVAYLTSAEAVAKEAMKMATAFSGSFPSFTTSTITNTSSGGGSSGHTTAAAAALLEATKTNLNVISEKKAVAIKDNDMIYHESVPKVETLPPVEKLNAVKPTSFADICANGQADIPKIIGPDIFQKLVPLSVHESASMYSEEKAKVLRSEQERVESANEELQATLESLNLVPILEKLKRLAKSPGAQPESLAVPDEVLFWNKTIQGTELGNSSTDELLMTIDGAKRRVREMLDESGLLLDKEQHECEAMRVKYGDLWTQEPSAHRTGKMRDDLRHHRESLEKAAGTDTLLLSGLDQSKQIVDVLRRPSDDVQTCFVDQLISMGPSKAGQKVGNLIDGADSDGAGLGVLDEQVLIQKVDGLLSRLRGLKRDREGIVVELKTKLHEDDISSLLLLNKNKESQVFQTELSKFKPLQGRLSANLQTHSQFLRDLATDFSKLEQSSQSIKNLDLIDKHRSSLVKEWGRAYEQWKEAHDGLKRGVEFYTSLSNLVETLRSSVLDFVRRRDEERVQLAKRVEELDAERRQRTLREQLQKLNVGLPPTPTAGPGPMSPGPMSPPPQQQFPPPLPAGASYHSPVSAPPSQQAPQPVVPPNWQQGPQSPPSGPGSYPPNAHQQFPSSPPSVAGRGDVQPFAPPPPSPHPSSTSPTGYFSGHQRSAPPNVQYTNPVSQPGYQGPTPYQTNAPQPGPSSAPPGQVSYQTAPPQALHGQVSQAQGYYQAASPSGPTAGGYHQPHQAGPGYPPQSQPGPAPGPQSYQPPQAASQYQPAQQYSRPPPSYGAPAPAPVSNPPPGPSYRPTSHPGYAPVSAAPSIPPKVYQEPPRPSTVPQGGAQGYSAPPIPPKPGYAQPGYGGAAQYSQPPQHPGYVSQAGGAPYGQPPAAGHPGGYAHAAPPSQYQQPGYGNPPPQPQPGQSYYHSQPYQQPPAGQIQQPPAQPNPYQGQQTQQYQPRPQQAPGPLQHASQPQHAPQPQHPGGAPPPRQQYAQAYEQPYGSQPQYAQPPQQGPSGQVPYGGAPSAQYGASDQQQQQYQQPQYQQQQQYPQQPYQQPLQPQQAPQPPAGQWPQQRANSLLD
ncbi:BRO1-like domain-containing protein [Fimicolochytrium jonesii]|uniref:BRO1-like domain-containing protein n=1 Tax=Fimicolochytrium jonesii TaxID=1396493 RepID=UPI0022FE5603|nr:BRO1-like domain-containing protein [Fimicolochytrium jonesii]KAI8818647.1 BRO1-like domain-containing protein [Fimicolochytrium jonesii]